MAGKGDREENVMGSEDVMDQENLTGDDNGEPDEHATASEEEDGADLENPSEEEKNGEEATRDQPPELYLQKYFRDHFTLPTPSSTIRYRSAYTAARVFENKTSQFVLEETYDPVNDDRKIQVKRMKDSTRRLQFLRAGYTLVCVLWTGIFFVFCLQVLLIMVLELAIQVGETEINPTLNIAAFIGVVIGLLVFCEGFASAMVISAAFVSDTWAGHFLVKQFFFSRRLSEVFVDWIFFTFFLMNPLLVLCFTLFVGSDNWWTITALFWFGSVAAFFVIFAANAVFFEVQGAIKFTRRRDDVNKDSLLDVWRCCVLLKQTHIYSGKKHIKYIARSVFQSESTEPAKSDDVFEATRTERLGPWTKLSKWGFFSTESPGGWPLFKPLDPPQALYTIDDVQDNRPFVTKYTWSLERLYCRPKNSRYVAVVHGPGALTEDQIKSSLACSIVGILLSFLLALAFVVWLDLGVVLIIGAVILCFLLAVPRLKDTVQLWKIANKVMSAKKDILQEGGHNAVEDAEHTSTSSELPQSYGPPTSQVSLMQSRRQSELNPAANEGIYLVSQYERVTEATELYCWIMMALELAIFFVYPAVTLFVIGDWTVGLLFIGVTAISALRHYVNLVTVIEETGHMSLVGGSNAQERWANQSRLSDIIQTISYDKSHRIWIVIMASFGLLLVGILLGAVGSTTDPTSDEALTFLPQSEYFYAPQPVDIRYPSCTLSNDLFGENSTLADFAFLASLPYKKEDIADSELQTWFGDEVVEEQETVDQWRNSSKTESSPVFFRLYRFIQKNTGVVSIRGTSNSWDLLADSQLWSAAMLVQGLRAVLPIGEMWTPILDELVLLIKALSSEALEQVSFYKVTTEFVKYLKKDSSYEGIQVTGHSLGGGIAIISGAQSGVPAVALSGPNAMLSGISFQPKVTHEQLNRYTFNIIPDRDPVPRFDDPADQIQRIRCTAAKNRLMDCHFKARSLCEIIYSCGTGNRPAFCECHTLYGYPKPSTLNGQSDFDELCKDSYS